MLPFLKYKEGSRPGKAKSSTKRKSSSSESQQDTHAKKTSYEEKRERKYMPHWTEGRLWLVFDCEKNQMFCTWCTENKVSDCKFVSGTNNFKLFAVKQHEASKYMRE